VLRQTSSVTVSQGGICSSSANIQDEKTTALLEPHLNSATSAGTQTIQVTRHYTLMPPSSAQVLCSKSPTKTYTAKLRLHCLEARITASASTG
jgi:hypothetical protein